MNTINKINDERIVNLNNTVKDLKIKLEKTENKYYGLINDKNKQFDQMRELLESNKLENNSLLNLNEVYRNGNLNNKSYDFILDLEYQILNTLDKIAKRKYIIFSKEKKIKSSALCTICYVNISEMLIYPCKHICVCKLCIEKIDSCPLCRENIVSILKINYNEEMK